MYQKALATTYLKALKETIKIKSNKKYKLPIFKPSEFLKNQTNKRVLIIGGSYDLKSHLKKFQELNNNNKHITIGVNCALMSGYKIDINFFELWQKTPWRDWFNENIINSNLFKNLSGDCKIVLTGLNSFQEGEKVSDEQPELFENSNKNFFIGLERSINLPIKGSDDEFVIKQIRNYLRKDKFFDTWEDFIPVARASVIKAVLFALKLEANEIFIAGLSNGKNSLHFWDNEDDFPDLIHFANKRRELRGLENHQRVHRTIRNDLGYWTLPRLINLISENFKENKITLLSKNNYFLCPIKTMDLL